MCTVTYYITLHWFRRITYSLIYISLVWELWYNSKKRKKTWKMKWRPECIAYLHISCLSGKYDVIPKKKWKMKYGPECITYLHIWLASAWFCLAASRPGRSRALVGHGPWWYILLLQDLHLLFTSHFSCTTFWAKHFSKQVVFEQQIFWANSKCVHFDAFSP